MVNGVTIPPDVMVTSSKPDLVLVDRSATPTRVDLVELTVPWDSGAEGARVRKQLRCHVSRLTFHVSRVTCHMSPIVKELAHRPILS